MSSEALENLMTENRRFEPPPAFAAQANVGGELYAEAQDDRLGFWAEQARTLDWDQPLSDSSCSCGKRGGSILLGAVIARLLQLHCERSSEGSRGGRPLRLRHAHHRAGHTPRCWTQRRFAPSVGIPQRPEAFAHNPESQVQILPPLLLPPLLKNCRSATGSLH